MSTLLNQETNEAENPNFLAKEDIACNIMPWITLQIWLNNISTFPV